MKNGFKPINSALLSVSDKTNIVDLARFLADFGVDIISTGGTAKILKSQGIKIKEVSEITGFPEILDGRVKTLHPKIHGGILAIRTNSRHLEQIQSLQINPIDLVVVNLYPFQEVLKRKDKTLQEIVENIDIGGPTMLRAAAKNWQDVAVVASPRFYKTIMEEMKANNGALSFQTRQLLALNAFALSAEYENEILKFMAEISKNYIENNELSNLSKQIIDEILTNNSKAHNLPDRIQLKLKKIKNLRYGENPQQNASVYAFSDYRNSGIANAQIIQGKEMSYNNYLDADAAWKAVIDFTDPACVIVKHTNPCGAGIGKNTLEAYERALSTDPVSAFGGIVAFNKTVDEQTAEKVIKVFTEVVVAPDYTKEALEIFSKRENLRLLKAEFLEPSLEYRSIDGGMLVQTPDCAAVNKESLQVVTKKRPSEAEIQALLFAWQVCKHVKSNAIVLANELQTLGIGAGQMNRLDSIKIAAMRAERSGFSLKGSVLASDAFFPFRDNVDEAAKYGISAIIQPGGSVRDKEVIEAADEYGISMVFTRIRHFKH
ncbi:MAG: bifunctional phosphoribosylaminoimidazolecarboxamide formyltransferase/IMP cyclohydrolase [Pyrinomonadaceae bacterium]|nr:bifunctional phosphoribosylaminoimidazolecarboxamide formyltransferase/IMP cyclohydrolase [Pyrinomonadaceae bacterium]MCX7639991.1 bifunctional phosphoribosylaminoimidazolecarboxamide formyltransferase/IMP cyclohydrolase [Pyrinomonadaceae bacterium]MDW8304163.1 bifunctional phosphoribosylaminoimidazolecarboxamide formyltransferase/IMP cyclohydrolase [Acidobacteriota bacterium]